VFRDVEGFRCIIAEELSPALRKEVAWYDETTRPAVPKPSALLAHTKARAAVEHALRRLGATDQSTVLTVACGSGTEVQFIEAVTQHIAGIDIAPAALKEFRRRHPNVQVYLALANWLPFPSRSFDFVVASGLLHHLVGQGRMRPFLREFHRVLAQGGAFVAVEPNVMYPLQWLLTPVNRVVQAIRPGWRGLVPHERPVSAWYLMREMRAAGFRDPAYFSSTFIHNRLPFRLAQRLDAVENEIRFRKPWAAFGWWVTVMARS